MLAVAIKERLDWDPRVLPGFLLSLAGFGVVLLVKDALSSQPARAPLLELAVAVALLGIFVRIWRANEDSGAVALLFTVLYGLRYYLRHSAYYGSDFDSGMSWVNLVYAVALLEISVGLWRAHQWARWTAAGATIFSSLRFLLMLRGVYPKDPSPPPTLSTSGLLVVFFVLFWAAIAVYLCLPSTAARFEEMRFDGE